MDWPGNPRAPVPFAEEPEGAKASMTPEGGEGDSEGVHLSGIHVVTHTVIRRLPPSRDILLRAKVMQATDT